MQTPIDTTAELSKTLAAEDVHRGDYVSILYEVVELPSYFWRTEGWSLAPDELVQLRCRTADCGTPLKVKAICLPFVFVKKPCGEHRTLDVRQHVLVRLSARYGRTVWKTLAKQAGAAKANPLAAIL